jgi:hypothetical protein
VSLPAFHFCFDCCKYPRLIRDNVRASGTLSTAQSEEWGVQSVDQSEASWVELEKERGTRSEGSLADWVLA